MFKEISVEEFGNEYNIMNIERDWAAISADNGEERNSMIIGWAGLGILWRLPMFTTYIHKSRFSKHIFDKAKYYSVSIILGDNREKHFEAWKYLGSKSGRNEDKFDGVKKLGLTIGEEEYDGNKVPYYNESDYVIICKMQGMSDFDLNKMYGPNQIKAWYEKDGVHTLYQGEIIKVLKKEK